MIFQMVEVPVDRLGTRPGLPRLQLGRAKCMHNARASWALPVRGLKQRSRTP